MQNQMPSDPMSLIIEYKNKLGALVASSFKDGPNGEKKISDKDRSEILSYILKMEGALDKIPMDSDQRDLALPLLTEVKDILLSARQVKL